MTRLAGRVHLVVGVSHGLGLAVARTIAAEGGAVMLADPDEAAVAHALEVLHRLTDAVGAVVCQPSRPGDAERAVALTLDGFGRLDALLGLVAPPGPQAFADLTFDDWRRAVEPSLHGAFRLLRAAAEPLAAHGQGRALLLSPVHHAWGTPGQVVAATVGGGVQSLISVVAKELWERRVTVNALVPLPDPSGPPAPSTPRSDGFFAPGLVWSGVGDVDTAAIVASWLVSPQAGLVTGRSVFTAGDSLGRIDEIDLQNALDAPGGWNWEALARHGRHVLDGGATFPAAFPNPLPAPAPVADGSALADRVAVVTGAGWGIGRTAAVEFARQGAAVVVNNRSRDNGQATVDAIVAAGGRAVLHHGDVADPASAATLVHLARDRFGRLDILYNNAGFIWPGPFDAMTDEQFDSLLATHLHGSFICIQAALPLMRAQRFGRILVTGSPGGYAHASPWAANYASAKGALTGLMRSLWKELLDDGISINTIVPNAPTTRRTAEEKARLSAPTRRWGRFGLAPMHALGPPTLEKIGPTLAWFVSDAVADVTGRVLFIGNEKLAVYRDPELRDVFSRRGGWTFDDLDRLACAVLPPGPPSPFYADDPVLTAGGGF